MDTDERIARSVAAKKAKAEAARAADSAARSVIAAHLAGTVPLGTIPLSRAESSTERSRRWRASGRELGDIPPPRRRRVRERFCFDLLGFGLAYGFGSYEGMNPLLVRAPSPRMTRFVRALQDKVLNGGLKHVRWPRGKGKSTWVKIAIMWAALYGHKHFMVVVEKTRGMAKVVVDEIWKRIYTSPRISVDFPEFAVPMADVQFSPQRMRVQTVGGRPTYMRQDVSSFNYYKLPTIAGMAHTGAIIAFRGADQALRGINIESSRPDFFFIDDPQTEEDARNPSTVEKIEKNITSAVLGSGQISERISAVMASTPIEPDDVSEVFADPAKHPEWETETERLVVAFGPDSLRSEYLRRMAVNPETAHTWYMEHRADIERGVEMMDDGDYNPSVESSAYEHALYMLFTMKSTSFFAEMQMQPARSQGIYKISPQIVRGRVNGFPFGTVPPECTQGVLSFVDVNVNAGLRWEIGAFGSGRRVATLAYGQYPGEGRRLYPKGVPESAIPAYLAPAMREVATRIMSVPLAGPDGEVVRCSGICFDGGWQTVTVASVVAALNASGISAAWSKGFSSREYSHNHHERAASGAVKGLKAAEECHLWATSNGVFLAYNSDYYKEVSQTSYLAAPLQPSSSSLYGEDPSVHVDWAQEICNEELKAKDSSSRYGSVYTWKKDPGRPNHYGDVHAGLLAYGAIRAFFDPIASVASVAEMTAFVKTKKRRSRYVYT